MELLVGMYGELIATLMLGLAAAPFLKKEVSQEGTNIISDIRCLQGFVREKPASITHMAGY